MTNRINAAKTVDANASSVLRIDSQEYLPEAASMTPPVLPEQPAQELEQFYPGSKRLLTIHDAGRFDNSPVVQIQQSLQEVRAILWRNPVRYSSNIYQLLLPSSFRILPSSLLPS